MNFSQLCSKIIKLSFHTLFFLVPLILCPLNFELFEYNKMMLSYTICIVICTAWLLKMVYEKRFYIRKTPLDIPLFLFLVSQVISTFFSIDPHTSIFGYYSRFHGGLLSTICYILLYYALVNNLAYNRQDKHAKKNMVSLLKTALFSAALVAIYGVLEHPNPLFKENGVWHGIDYNYWVQDVELRVFSTIGQPNWLAAYLSMLIPVAIAFMLITQINADGPKIFYLILASLFYWCLLFTNSRAGAVGLFVGLFSFFLFLIRTKFSTIVERNVNLIFLSLLLSIYLVLTLISGKFLIGRFTEMIPRGILKEQQEKQEVVEIEEEKPPLPSSVAPTTPVGETGRIRNIVWQGAIEIFKHYPLFGSGVETFAYSYYQSRPKEHNLTTEWDFLYNKAHNEYLNFLATTGVVGLSTYLLIIFTFGWWFIRYFRQINANGNSANLCESILILGLFSGYIAYLVQNFYSFSIVPIALFFFLFPGIAFVLTGSLSIIHYPLSIIKKSVVRYALYVFILVASAYCLVTLSCFWLADTNFAKAHNLASSGYFNSSYLYALKAIAYNPREPLYFDQLAYNAAVLATEAKEATTSALLAQEAVSASQRALTISPLNINFWKTAIKVFYQLGSLNEEFYQKALEAAKIAIQLSPTEPKLPYNLGLIYLKLGDQEKAIEALKKAIDLKPDLRDPHYALAVVYHKQATEAADQELLQKAISELEYMLKNIDPGDTQAQEKLREWKD